MCLTMDKRDSQGGVAALNEALKSVDRNAVKALSISGQQHGFVPVDQSGQVLDSKPDEVKQTILQPFWALSDSSSHALCTSTTASSFSTVKQLKVMAQNVHDAFTAKAA